MKFDKTSTISLLILLTGLLLEAFGVRCSCIYLTIIYLFLTITSIKSLGNTHSFTLFLFCFGVFLMGRVFLDVLGILEVNHATKWEDYYLSNKTVVIVNTSMALSLIFIRIGLNKKNNPPSSSMDTETQEKICKFTKALLFILIPFAIAKFYFDFSVVRSGSYTDYFLGEQRSPFIIRAGWYMATLLLPILLINTLDKKSFKFYLALFLVLNFFDFLTGSRGALIRPGMFFLWYYYRVISKKKVNNAIILAVFILFAFVGNLLLEMRGDKQEKTGGSLAQVMYVFESLGGSYYINAYYVDFHDKLDGVEPLYIVGPIIDGVRGFFDRDLRGQSEERIVKSYGLSHKLTYYIGRTSYLEGHGLGSSYIAEIYSTAGLFSVIFFSLVIGWIMKYVEINATYSPYARIMSWFWIQSLSFMPRGDPFSFLINYAFALVILQIIKIAVTNRKSYNKGKQFSVSEKPEKFIQGEIN